jgi:hypothetical protein
MDDDVDKSYRPLSRAIDMDIIDMVISSWISSPDE